MRCHIAIRPRQPIRLVAQPLKPAPARDSKAKGKQQKADAATPEARKIYLLFQKSFLDLADALDQDGKLREFGSGHGPEV